NTGSHNAGQAYLTASLAFAKRGAYSVIDQHRGKDERQVCDVPPAIEEQAGQYQPRLASDHQLGAVQPEVDEERHWQESQDEFVRIEEHVTPLRACILWLA